LIDVCMDLVCLGDPNLAHLSVVKWVGLGWVGLGWIGPTGSEAFDVES